MKVYYGFEALPPEFAALATARPRAVAVGSFDGVHRGHRLLIDRLAEQGQAVVVTFDPHPRQLLRAENRLLTTLPERLQLLRQTPVEVVVVVEFTPQFSRISSQEFVDHYLIARLGASCVLSGEGHHFGHNRSGTRDTLERKGLSTHFTGRYRNISSTDIRSAIERGDMAAAADMLGGPYLILTRPHDPTKLLPPPGEYEVLPDGESVPMRLRIDPSIFDPPLRWREIRIVK